MEFGNDTTQRTQWTFAHANLVRTCYGLIVYVVDLFATQRGSHQLLTDLLRGYWCNIFSPY